MTGQPVAALPVGGDLTCGDHSAECDPGPVPADAEQAGQVDQVGDRQFGRVLAEQRAGKD
jgi:hypothetical protein